VPDHATCTLNHRVAPDRTRDQATASLVAFLDGVIDNDDTVSVSDWAPAAKPELTNSHLAELVELTGAPPRGKVGWTDVATFSELGIPATNFGAGDPLLAHRSDEFVTSRELDEFARTLGAWLG
jgi:succinyl-diaminopimelate desuccinylase